MTYLPIYVTSNPLSIIFYYLHSFVAASEYLGMRLSAIYLHIYLYLFATCCFWSHCIFLIFLMKYKVKKLWKSKTYKFTLTLENKDFKWGHLKLACSLDQKPVRSQACCCAFFIHFLQREFWSWSRILFSFSFSKNYKILMEKIISEQMLATPSIHLQRPCVCIS